MTEIRTETTADHPAVRKVIVDAFTGSEFGHNGEADLVDQLRRSCDRLLSLVAVDDEQVVGQVLFSPVTFQGGEVPVAGMGLAPMAVLPGYQRRGIGSLLIRSGLARLAKRSCPFVVVLGHPEYYQRFGFQPAAGHGIRHGFAGIPQEVLFVTALDGHDLTSVRDTAVLFRAEFGPQNAASRPRSGPRR